MEKHGTASRQVAGWYVEFQMAVLRALPRDISQEIANGWRGNGESLARVLREALSPNNSQLATFIPVSYPVFVDYGKSVEDGVKAGRYDWSDSDITTKNFPSKRKGTVCAEIVLVHFNRDIECDEAFRELDKQGLRPAGLPELLSFGAKYLDVQRKFPIVALGSTWLKPEGNRVCVYLARSGSKRVLFLCAFNWWHSSCCFAAVRK